MINDFWVEDLLIFFFISLNFNLDLDLGRGCYNFEK